MTTRRSKITARYLTHFCRTGANDCMSFGRQENTRIRAFFDYLHFKYATGQIKLLPSDSNNGRIGIIQYNRDGFGSAALLKVSLRRGADNPYFEYVVGMYVNKYLVNRFPCFTETYGLVKMDVDTRETLIRKNGSVGTDDFSMSVDDTIPLAKLTSDEAMLSNMCMFWDRQAVLAQYYNDTISLRSFGHNGSHDTVTLAAPILIQLYGPLGAVASEFTHYDLHAENVLLVPTPKDTYVTMHYHWAPGTNHVSTFKTSYIAKIIDYGRCFFKKPTKAGESDGGESSITFKDLICSSTACLGKCGSNAGFWLNPTNPNHPYQITPYKANRTSDLLAGLEICETLFQHTKIQSTLLVGFQR